MDAQFPLLCSSKPLKPGSEDFQKIPITTNFFKLGRGHHNNVIIPYKCLSKDHCIFKKVEEEWMLENCSYSRIKVNEDTVRKGESRKLTNQDVIKFESSNELVYTFMATPKTSKRKRCKLDDDLINDSKRKKSVSPKSSTRNGVVERDTQRVKEQIMSEQSKKEKEVYDDYATRIEKLKGSKKIVKRQKALLKMQRNTRLELIKVKMEERMAFLMAQETKPLNENKPSKELSNLEKGDHKSSSKEKLDQSDARREQDRRRVKEKRELKKLRRETRRLKLDKEKKLKELEKENLRRQMVLKEELNEVNKKFAKERELHEKERRRVEQLLNQKEELKKVSPGTSSEAKLDMESELQCSICSELFVRATTLGCSHSFCQYCIRKWTAKKRECPICRAPITSVCRSIVLDSLVEKMAVTADAKQTRQQLVKARDELEAKEATELNRENQNPFWSIIPDFLYGENSDSSYRGRESSLEPDSDMLVPMDTESESTSDASEASTGSDVNEFEDEHYEGSEYGGYGSDSQENEDNYDEAPEIDGEEEEENEGDSTENYGPDDENYGENSPSEHDEQEEQDTEDHSEDDESAPENYDEGDNSMSEHYDEGENSAPEHDGDYSASEHYDEGDNSAPEHDGDENSEPENYEGEISEPENYEEQNSEPENYEGEISEPENYEEQNSEPENYDEGENSEPDNYDEGENSPGYDVDSYTDDDGDYY